MSDSQQTVEATGTTGRDGRSTRLALWLALAVSLAVNVVASNTGDHLLLSIAAGLLALTCGAALIAHHRRHRP